MGLLFSDDAEDQAATMMQNMSVGMTWQFRYMRLRWTMFAIMTFILGAFTVALADYFIFTSTGKNGVIGLLIDRWFS